MVSANVIDDITGRIVQEFDPVEVILFGSRARGEARPDSDVDLLVVLEEAPDPRQCAVAIQRALLDVRVPKDIIVATPRELAERGHIAGTVLRPALREGRVLYRRERMTDNRGEALRWLRFADEDLAAAKTLTADISAPARHACYLAQQAAEKAIKAALVLMDIDPPKTHSLDALRDTLPGGWNVQTAFADLAWLSEWNASGRYPGDWPEARHEDAEQAIAEAGSVISSIRGDFARRGIVPA